MKPIGLALKDMDKNFHRGAQNEVFVAAVIIGV